MRLNLKKREVYTLRVVITPNMMENVKGDREKAAKDIAAFYAAHQLHKYSNITKEEATYRIRQMFEERGTLNLRSDGAIDVVLLMENETELADISEYKNKQMVNIKEI